MLPRGRFKIPDILVSNWLSCVTWVETRFSLVEILLYQPVKNYLSLSFTWLSGIRIGIPEGVPYSMWSAGSNYRVSGYRRSRDRILGVPKEVLLGRLEFR